MPITINFLYIRVLIDLGGEFVDGLHHLFNHRLYARAYGVTANLPCQRSGVRFIRPHAEVNDLVGQTRELVAETERKQADRYLRSATFNMPKLMNGRSPYFFLSPTFLYPFPHFFSFLFSFQPSSPAPRIGIPPSGKLQPSVTLLFQREHFWNSTLAQFDICKIFSLK